MLDLQIDTPRLTRLRERSFAELRKAMPPANFGAAVRCSARLQEALPNRSDLTSNLVMVAYGGGKDSSYTLAFVRMIQLILLRIFGGTFRLRSVTNRHVGMPQAVLENIHRVYEALRLFDDPDCELLLVEGDEIAPFRVDKPPSERLRRRNRFDILMTGHRTFGDPRPTFCNACNLSMANSFGLGAAYGDGVDLFITGDSPREQRAYTVWVRRLAQQVDPAAAATPESGFKGFMTDLDRIAMAYFTDIYGAEDAAVLCERRIATDVPARMRFFSIYDDTEYAAGDHFQLLTEYLGFQFDELAFSFTESDCGNPTLMAHLRGLKCERVFGRSYEEGVKEYVQFAVGLMRKKDFPAPLIEAMVARYATPQAVATMREVASQFALDCYGLSDEQLICMLYSPFTQAGASLDRYVAREQPRLLGRQEAIRAFLGGEVPSDPRLAEELERISGLASGPLRLLYGSPIRGTFGRKDPADLIQAGLAGDPHKGVIRTQHAPVGPVITEQISGR